MNVYDESPFKIIKTSFLLRRFKFSPNGRKIALCGESKYVDVLDIDSNLIISRLNSQSSRVTNCYWSCCGNIIITISFEEQIRIWSVQSQELLFKYDGKNECELLTTISFCRNFLISSVFLEGRRIIKVLYIGNIKYNRKKITKVKEIVTENKIKSIVLSPDRENIITGDEKGKIIIWNYFSGEIVKIKNAHERFLTSIDITASGNFIISGCYDGVVKIWKFDKWFIN